MSGFDVQSAGVAIPYALCWRTHSSLSQIGDAEVGAVAAATTTAFSKVSGGIASVFGAVVLVRLLPQLVRVEGSAGGSVFDLGRPSMTSTELQARPGSWEDERIGLDEKGTAY